MSRKVAIAGLFVALVGLSLLFVAHSGSGRTSALRVPLVRGSESQGASEHVEAELLVLHSDGFKPNEIIRRPGRFLLALQNHSSEEEISLALKQESGASVREIRMPKRQSKLKEFLYLPPGRYVLVETNHREWICTVIITPQ